MLLSLALSVAPGDLKRPFFLQTGASVLWGTSRDCCSHVAQAPRGRVLNCQVRPTKIANGPTRPLSLGIHFWGNCFSLCSQQLETHFDPSLLAYICPVFIYLEAWGGVGTGLWSHRAAHCHPRGVARKGAPGLKRPDHCVSRAEVQGTKESPFERNIWETHLSWGVLEAGVTAVFRTKGHFWGLAIPGRASGGFQWTEKMTAQEGAGKHKGILEKRRSLERVASWEPGEGTEGCQPPPELPPVAQPCVVCRGWA